MKKQCRICGLLLPLDRFYFRIGSSDGLRGECKNCKRDSDKQYRALNEEKHKERSRKYREENHDVLVIGKRKWYLDNAEKIKKRVSEYKKTATGKRVCANSKHKRRSITGSGCVSAGELRSLLIKSKKCYWCNMKFTKGIVKHIDHYVSIKNGGQHVLQNLVVSCAHCNLSKRHKDPYVFAMEIGRLL